MITTNNPEYYKKLYLLRTHGMTSLSFQRSLGHITTYDVLDIGYNYRMDDVRASLGLVQLGKLENDIKLRKQIRAYYIENLSMLEQITIPFLDVTGNVSNYIFPIVLKKSTSERRDFIRNELKNYGIQTSVHYPAVHRFSFYFNNSLKLKKTEYVSENEITLPLYSSLKTRQIEYICECLRKIIK